MEDAAAREPGRKDLPAGAGQYVCARQRYDAAIARFQELLKADPKSADLLLRLAETQRRKGDINAAIDTFRRASQVGSDAIPGRCCNWGCCWMARAGATRPSRSTNRF